MHLEKSTEYLMFLEEPRGTTGWSVQSFPKIKHKLPSITLSINDPICKNYNALMFKCYGIKIPSNSLFMDDENHEIQLIG